MSQRDERSLFAWLSCCIFFSPPTVFVLLLSLNLLDTEGTLEKLAFADSNNQIKQYYWSVHPSGEMLLILRSPIQIAV